MPKKRGPEYEEKRAALRRAAARMLAESPFDIPSWPTVAAEIGMSQGAIAYYYGNLRNLLWAVVSEHLRQLLERLGEEAPDTIPPRERIIALARSYAGVIRDHEPEHSTTMTHQLRLDPARSRDAREMQGWVLGLFEDAFAATLPRSAASRAMPLALSLVSLLNGHAEWFREHKDLDRLAYAEMAARMALSEVGPRRQRSGLRLDPNRADCDQPDLGPRNSGLPIHALTDSSQGDRRLAPVAGSSCNTLRKAA